MHLNSKQRVLVNAFTVSLLTVLIGWWGTRLFIGQKEAVISTLADHLQRGETKEAVAAVEQLGNLDEAAIEHLVRAALTARPRIAPAARWTIEDLISRWQNESARRGTAGLLGKRFERLAVALAADVETFPADGKLWARGVARHLLANSSQIPAGQRLTLVRNCEYVLRVTSDLEATNLVAGTPNVGSDDTGTVSSATQPKASTSPSDREAASKVADPPAPSDGGGPQQRTAALPPPPESNSLEFVLPADDTGSGKERKAGDPVLGPPQVWRPQSPQAEPAAAPDFGNPAPLPPKVRSFGEVAQRISAAAARETELAAELTELDTAQLVSRLVVSVASERDIVEFELRRRDFGSLPTPLAEMLISPDDAQRQRAVEAVLQAPGVKPSPWLLMLADDPSADVRLAVASLLATSDDPVLMEKAWNMALHDRDPRIARLSKVLRTRRGDRQRR